MRPLLAARVARLGPRRFDWPVLAVLAVAVLELAVLWLLSRA